MHRNLLSSLSFLLVFFLVFSLNAQNNQEQCATHLIHDSLMQTDSAYAARIAANEAHIQATIQNQNQNNNIQLQNNGVLTIPVVIHVIHTGQAVGVGANISDAQIQSGLDMLNDRYRKTPGTHGDGNGVDSEIEFCLAVRDPNCSTTTGINRVNGSSVTDYSSEGITAGQGSGADEVAVKNLSRWSNTDYLNIWIVTEIEDNNGLFGIQGYAYFPGAPASVDGIVIMHTAFGNIGTVNNFNNLGRTLVHEVGHYLNLYHTFEGDNNGTVCPPVGNLCGSGQGDCCGDTERHKRSGSNCLIGSINTCINDTIGDVIHNYMDYSSQDCANMYTLDQKDRQRAVLCATRAGLLSSLGCTPVTIAGPVTPSCSPQTTNLGNGFGMGVINLTFQDMDVTSSGAVNDGGYVDRTCGQSTDLDPSTAYTISVETGPANNEDVKVYIDYNGDGDFLDAGEEVFSSLNDTVHTGTVTTPANPTMDAYLRMRVVSDFVSNTITGSCYAPQYGQVEDYSVIFRSTLSITETHVDVSCNGLSDGSIDITVTGGTTPYSYLWNTGDTIEDITGLTPGTYTVTATDSAGSSDSLAVTIIEAPTLMASVSNSMDVLCNGDSNGSATVSGSGGTVASLSTNSYIIDQSGTFSPYGIGLAPGNATAVNLLDDQESAALPIGFSFEFFGNTYTTFSISSNGYISFPPFGNIGVAGCCSGENIPSNANPFWNDLIAFAWEDLNPQLGGSIEYYTTGTAPNRILVVNFIDVAHTFSPTDLVTSQVVLYETSNIIEIHTTEMDSDGGIHTMGIENSNGTVAYAVPGRNASNWSVTNDYVAFLPDSGAYTFAWPGGGTNATQSGLSAGIYVVTVTDDNGCSDTTTVIINEPSPLALSAVITDVSIFGGNDGSIDAFCVGGTSPYNYVWSNGANTEDISGLVAGTYTVTVTDNNGCTETASYVVNQPVGGITLTFTTTDVSCNGTSTGAIDLTVSGGTNPLTYNWSNGASSEDLTGIAAGTYTVTVTDGGGITQTGSATITEPTVLTATGAATDVTCNGGNDGSATASGTGGTGAYNFAWSNGGITPTITGLSAGTYTATVTDNNGCTATTSATVNQPSALSASISSTTNVTCNGGNDGTATASASGGLTPYSYNWSNGTTTASITGIASGTYTVTITDNNGCTGTAVATITQPSAISVTTTVMSNVSCNGNNDGSLSATASGGSTPYAYLWSNGMLTATISGLVAGTYTVTVSDNNGCTGTSSAIVSEPAALTISFSGVIDVSCNGANDGAVTAVANGGTAPYSYNWSNGSNTDTISGLAPGGYIITITDNNGCTIIDSMFIAEPSPLNALINASDASCNGASDGFVIIQPQGGTSPYSYSWNNGQITDSLTGIAAGTYSVTVTDNNGCSIVEVVPINEPAPLVANVTVQGSTVICNGSTVTMEADTGVGYSYQWQRNGIDLPGANNLTYLATQVGNYRVVISINNNCNAVSSIVSVSAGQITASFTGLGLMYCEKDSVGTLVGSPAGGTFSGPGVSGTTFDPLVAGVGMHQVQYNVTDSNNCSDTEVKEVEVLPSPAISSITGPGATQPFVTYFYSVTPTNGSVYVWSVNGGNIINIISNTISVQWNNVQTGTVSVTETNTFGCTDSIGMDVAVDFPSAVKELGSLNDIKVYPNPASQELFVSTDLGEATNLQIRMISITGQQVLAERVNISAGQNVKRLGVDHLSNGVYLLHINSDEDMVIQRIVINR